MEGLSVIQKKFDQITDLVFKYSRVDLTGLPFPTAIELISECMQEMDKQIEAIYDGTRRDTNSDS